jgi:hypothetical protein
VVFSLVLTMARLDISDFLRRRHIRLGTVVVLGFGRGRGVVGGGCWGGALATRF